jgi:hypothetical protein
MMNLATDEMNMVAGVNLGGKVAIPVPPSASVFNNISVTNSTIGVLTTAAVGQVSACIGRMPKGDVAGAALVQITSTVADAPMDDAKRKNLLDQIAVVAEQAAAEPQKRQPAVIGPILAAITEAAGTTKAVAEAWKVVQPIMKAYFGLP